MRILWSFVLAAALVACLGAAANADYILDNGTVSWWLNASEGTEPRDNWFANVFTAQANDPLISYVSFAGANVVPGLTAVIYIDTDGDGNPATGTLQRVRTETPSSVTFGSDHWAQIVLTTPLYVTPGQKFVVAMFAPNVQGNQFPFAMDTSTSAAGTFWGRTDPGLFNLDNLSGVVPLDQPLQTNGWIPGAAHMMIRAGVPEPSSLALVVSLLVCLLPIVRWRGRRSA
jgi:hypothetical protein